MINNTIDKDFRINWVIKIATSWRSCWSGTPFFCCISLSTIRWRYVALWEVGSQCCLWNMKLNEVVTVNWGWSGPVTFPFIRGTFVSLTYFAINLFPWEILGASIISANDLCVSCTCDWNYIRQVNDLPKSITEIKWRRQKNW